MNPPLFAILLLFLGPIAVLLGGRVLFLLIFLAAAIGTLLGLPAVLPAWILAMTASYGLLLCGGPGAHPVRGILLWVALCTVPIWAPHTAWWWSLWPGHGIPSSTWDPLAAGWFYQSWGSGAQMPTPSYLAILLSYLGICGLLRCGFKISSTIQLRDTTPAQRDET